jgi:hypothetical protein
MLQDESRTPDRPWSRSRHLLAGLCLLGAAVGVAMFRGPALAGENEKGSDAVKPDVPAARDGGTAGGTPFDLRYVSDETEGMIAFRPAATFRRSGMPVTAFTALISDISGVEASDLAKQLKIDPSAPGRLRLGFDNIDWVITNLHFGPGGNHPGKQEMHRFELHHPTVRTTRPFDWLRFLREWRLDFSEAHEGGQKYFKVTGILKSLLGQNPCVYLPDDRTIVFDEEARIQKMLRREKPVVPAYLAGKDWEPFSRGILAVAINNHDGEFTKSYDLGRPDDAVVLSLLKGVDRWMLGVDDADEIVLHASAVCRDDTNRIITRSVESLMKMARDALKDAETKQPSSESAERAARMAKNFLTNLHVGLDGHAVELRSDGFGTLAEFSSLVEAAFKEQAGASRGPHP